MTIDTRLKKATSVLYGSAIPNASLDAELLLSHILRQPREYLLAHGDTEVTPEQEQQFNDLVAKRADHVPLAYLTHEKYFYGRPLYVDERVLVPRPETEELINALTPCPLSLEERGTVIDVGTGSGCIIITLAKEWQNKNVDFFAVDISDDALAVARKNAQFHDVEKKITFLQGNLLEPLMRNSAFTMHHSPCIITANLPYVPTAHVDREPSIKHEPRLALDSGPDGLDHYRELARQLQQWNPRHATLLCEIGEEQAAAMRDIFSFADRVEIKKDLAGRDRIAVITL